MYENKVINIEILLSEYFDIKKTFIIIRYLLSYPIMHNTYQIIPTQFALTRLWFLASIIEIS